MVPTGCVGCCSTQTLCRKCAKVVVASDALLPNCSKVRSSSRKSEQGLPELQEADTADFAS